METSPAAASPFSHLRVAIVHYWFVGRAGGERVVESIAEIFPQADLFALISEPSVLAPVLRNRKMTTSFLQRLPGAKRFHRHFFPLQPLALEQFDLSGYDLVISSESGPAKGVITSPRTLHICYCHSPMRYIWEMYPQYTRSMNPVVRAIFTLTSHYMRLWDHSSAARVDSFVANSRFVATRIRKYYAAPSRVIHPPVDVSSATPADPAGDYYLAVGRMVDYKRFDLAIDACTRLGRPLHVIGEGPEYKQLRRLAGSSVKFLGRLSDTELRSQMAHCRALLFPGEEDFGIVPVEAQSVGRPVIAFASGGVLETVSGLNALGLDSPHPTGVFFREQTLDSIVQGILEFEANESRFLPAEIQRHAAQFSADRFKREMSDFILERLTQFRQAR